MLRGLLGMEIKTVYRYVVHWGAFSLLVLFLLGLTFNGAYAQSETQLKKGVDPTELNTEVEARTESTSRCEPAVYYGVQHCSDDNGNTHIIIVNLDDPNVKVQPVLPVGKDIDGNTVECNSVNHQGTDTNFGCDDPNYTEHRYPVEYVESMLGRYIPEGGAAIINGDYFGADHKYSDANADHGPQGLTVRIGNRLDDEKHDPKNDDGKFLGSTQPSLAVSFSKTAIIGIPEGEQSINDNLQGMYYNAIGGWPFVDTQKALSDLDPCTNPTNYDENAKEACENDTYRSAVGLTSDRRLILITTKVKTVKQTAEYLKANFPVQSVLNFDGGRSASMAWLDGNAKVQSYRPCDNKYTILSCYPYKPLPIVHLPLYTGAPSVRPVAEGLLISSKKKYGCSSVATSIDTALIIDSSGSMVDSDPQDMRKKAAEVFIKAMVPSDRLAIIDFSDAAQIDWSLQTRGCASNSAIAAVETIGSFGGTNIGAGLKAGFDQLSTSESADTLKAAILLTDGQGGYTNEAQLFASKGWKVFTVGLGNGVDENLLRQIANETGGQYTFLTDPQQLVTLYSNLNTAIASGTLLKKQQYSLLPNETKKLLVNVPPTQDLVNFLVTWPGSLVTTSLIDPDGRRIISDTVNQDPNISHFQGATFEFYQVIAPKAGNWTLESFGAELPPQGENIIAQAAVRNTGGQFSSYINAPVILTCEHLQWKAETWIVNNTNADFINGAVSITLPSGLSLASGQPATQSITQTLQGDQQKVEWLLIADQTTMTQTLPYSTTTVFQQGLTSPQIATGSVLVPQCIQNPSVILNVDQTTVPADGIASSTITVTVKDTLGNPLPHQLVILATTLGAVTQFAETDNTGIATAKLSAGTVVGTATVIAQVGNTVGTANITIETPSALPVEDEPSLGNVHIFLPLIQR